MDHKERLIRVLLAEDNLLVREGLKRLINQEQDMKVIAETGDGEDALQLAQRLSTDVALVDVSMPRWDGVRLAREMSRACPSVKIIAVTRHDDGGFVRKMMAAGACGYVLKQSASSTLVHAVRVCNDGAVFIDPGVSAALSPSDTAVTATPVMVRGHEPLTRIEDQVLRLFGSALSTQMIAEQLSVDPDEVVRVKEAAMRKLGITTRLQVLAYVRSRDSRSHDSR